MRLEYQDNIDMYLLGRMSDEEYIAFEAKCAENSELKEQLELTRDVKVAITDRSKMLTKIQEWDYEYDADKKKDKKAWMYWLYGTAAVLMAAFFLVPTRQTSETEEYIEVASANQESKDVTIIDNELNNTTEKIVTDQLLAQNNEDKQDVTGSDVKQEKDKVFSFGLPEFKERNPRGQDVEELELSKIKEEIRGVEQNILKLHQQLKDGKISKDFHDSSISLLKYQRDNLLWREARSLIETNRSNEALVILEELRGEKGPFRDKADSLYNEIIQ